MVSSEPVRAHPCCGRTPCTLCLFLICWGYSLAPAQVEEFVIAAGGRFAEQPQVVGNSVLWQAYGRNGSPDTIQYRDISRLDNPNINVAPYPAMFGGVLSTPDFVFRGIANGFGGGSPVLARPVAALREGTATDLFVSDFGNAVGATPDFVFLKVSWYEREPFSSKFFAKAISDFGDRSLDTLKFIAAFREQTLISRSEAVSKRYFVWQDRDPTVVEDTWKIYAKRTEDLFTPGTERLVLDSKVYVQQTLGVYLALHDNLLVVQAAEEHSQDSLMGLYLINLDSAEAPVPIATTNTIQVDLQWPSISKDYVVWAELRDFFERRAFALRLVDGKPEGEPFLISSGTAGGSWVTIDRNIAVWNGATSFGGGAVFHEAIMAAELPLPGADDVGDLDQDGRITLTDAVLILNYLFREGWKPRLRLSDADTNGAIQLSDAVVIIKYLFSGGTRPGT